MSSTALSTPTAEPRDFADWLSPMIVKELRQGTRTNVFVAVFLITQVLMLLCMFVLSTSAHYSPGADSGFVGGLFWFAIGTFLLVGMPLRGLGAIQGEVKANTLELIYLTRLTATKIIVGKWFSIVLQSWLIVAAVLPYFVLRYFFGGVEIVNDLLVLGVMLLLNAVITALMIALSSAPVAIRILLFVPICLFGGGAMIGLLELLFSPFGGSVSFGGNPFGGWRGMLALLYFTACYTALLLEIAATRIAPEAENHAARKRLLALLLLVPAGLAACFHSGSSAMSYFATAAPALIYVFAEGLSERTASIPSLFRRFSQRGPLARLGAYWLTPGWASALLFTFSISVPLILALVVAWKASLPSSATSDELGFPTACIAALGALILPVILLQTAMKRARQPLLNYLLLQLGFMLIGTVCTILLHFTSTAIAIYPVAFIPAATLLYMLTGNDVSSYTTLFLLGNSLTLIASLLVLAPLAIREYIKIARFLKPPARPELMLSPPSS